MCLQPLKKNQIQIWDTHWETKKDKSSMNSDTKRKVKLTLFTSGLVFFVCQCAFQIWAWNFRGCRHILCEHHISFQNFRKYLKLIFFSSGSMGSCGSGYHWYSTLVQITYMIHPSSLHISDPLMLAVHSIKYTNNGSPERTI